MPQLVPLQAIPNQLLSISLGSNETVQLYVHQNVYGLFIDVFINNATVVGGVLCENLNLIIRNWYFGFDGDLYFWDQYGDNDPYYDGLGGRYKLVYVTAAELAAMGQVNA